MIPPNHDSGLRQTYMTVASVGALLTVSGFAFAGIEFCLSTALGATIAFVNLVLLSRSVSRVLAGGRTTWAALFVVKFAALLLLTYLLIDRGLVVPLGLALGFGALPLGVVLGGFWTPEQTGQLSEAASLPSVPTGARESAPRKD